MQKEAMKTYVLAVFVPALLICAISIGTGRIALGIAQPASGIEQQEQAFMQGMKAGDIAPAQVAKVVASYVELAKKSRDNDQKLRRFFLYSCLLGVLLAVWVGVGGYVLAKRRVSEVARHQ